MPVHPLNVPSYDTIADYKKIYGHYENKMNAIPYKWPYSCTTEHKSSVDGSSTSDSVGCDSTSTSTKASHEWTYAIVGVALGIMLMYIKEAFVNKNRHTYLPIN